MWLSASGILLLFLYVNPTLSKEDSSDGMIKNAILSLARIIRDHSQKVEKYEMREYRQSENLKKAMEDLTKQMSGVETYVTHFSKIEDRISEIEQLISQRDERERIQMQKTADSIGNLETHLEAKFDEIKNTITEVSQHVKPTEPTETTKSVSASDIIYRINDTEAHLLKKVSQIESSLHNIASKSEEAVAQTQKTDEKQRIQNQNTEKLIENLESRLKTQLDEIGRTVKVIVETTPPTPTIECASPSDIVSILNHTEAHFIEKVAEIESTLDTMAIKNAHEAATQAGKLHSIFNERDERESIQTQKTEKLIENSESRLKRRLDEIKSTIDVIIATTPPTPTIECASASQIVSILNDTETHLLEKVAEIESNLDTMVIKNVNETAMQAEKKLQMIFNEMNVKESIQNRKMIETSESRLTNRLDEIKSMIDVIVETTPPTPTIECASASDIVSILNTTEAHVLEKVALIESSLDTMAIQNDNETTTQAEKLQTVFDEVQNMGDGLGDILNSLEKVHATIKKEAEKSAEPIVDIGAIFEEQTRALGNVTEFIENILNRIQDLPTTSENQALHNETQAALQEAKHTLQSAVSDKINGMITTMDKNNEEIKHTIENVRSDLAGKAEHMNKELNELVGGQARTVAPAQELLDTKKSMEFVLQMIFELHESIKNHSTEIHETLKKKFDGVSNDIMGNHSRAIANLTTKMEEELKQVWRQITPMYQQMIDNARALNKLNEQNEAYVKGTTLTMDGMETKVGDITKRMNEVNDNLNYLLGRLSVMSQEFNQIKTGLGVALDNIKATFKEVKEKADGLSHPGRQNIPHDYRGDEETNSNVYTTSSNLINPA